jgi:hypothetical protein
LLVRLRLLRLRLRLLWLFRLRLFRLRLFRLCIDIEHKSVLDCLSSSKAVTFVSRGALPFMSQVRNSNKFLDDNEVAVL